MALKAVTPRNRLGSLPRDPARETVVIADSGDSATVIVVHTDEYLEIGSTFRHDSSTWRVTGRRPHSRALVASPLRS